MATRWDGVQVLVADDRGDLGADPLGHRVVGEDGVQRPADGGAGRVVAGGDERHDLVAHLLVGEAVAVAVVVLGGEQRVEDVAAVVAGIACRRRVISPKMISSAAWRARMARRYAVPGRSWSNRRSGERFT